MRLFIAPKRDVALSISVALGGPSVPTGASFKIDDDDEVTWLAGHLLRLANPQEHDERYDTWSLNDLPMQWPITYLPDDRHQSQLAAVIELAQQADELVNAGDPDPEGQRLVDEVIEYAGLESKPMTRLLINDNNPMAILKASLSMRNNQHYRGLSLSALARSVCDQRYGFNLTRAYTLLARQKGYIGVLSVGRVQTPILGLIVARDKACQSHQATTYNEVIAEVKIKNQLVQCQYIPELSVTDKDSLDNQQIDFVEIQSNAGIPATAVNETIAKQIITAITDKPVTLVSAITEESSIPAPLPHSLLSLQAEAAGQYGYKPSRVHEIAQKLRDEHMAVTYHRSDSRYLSNERFREAPALLEALSVHYPDLTGGCDKTQRSPAFNSDKVTSHHAIIPTLNVPAPAALEQDEQRIYDLIIQSYAIQFYGTAVDRVTTLLFETEGYHFKSVGRVVKSLGWRAISAEAGEMPIDLSSITRFDHGKLTGAKVVTQTTKGPERYTMRTLLEDLTQVAQYVTDPAIKKLLLDKDSAKQDEAGGIGTPATRDKHIETLFTRGFITETDSAVISTEIGRDFHNALPDFAVKPDMTALWHEKQRQIESGLLDYQTFISDVDTIIADEVDRAKRVGLNIKVKAIDCPSCKKGHLVLRTSKVNKQFWGCSEFPNCRTTFSDVKGRPEIN